MLLVSSAAIAGLLIAVRASSAGLDGFPPVVRPERVAAFVFAAMLALAYANAYGDPLQRRRQREWLLVVGAVSFATTVVTVLAPVYLTDEIPASHIAVLWGIGILTLVGGRAIARQALRLLAGGRFGALRMIVVGPTATAVEALKRLGQDGSRYRVIGLVAPDNSSPRPKPADGVSFLGTMDALEEIVTAQGVREVLIAVPPHGYGVVGNVVRSVAPSAATVRLALTPLLDGARVTSFDVVTGLASLELPLSGFPWQYRSLKRALDITVPLLAFPLVLPVMGLIALAVKVDTAGPVLFRQERVGRHGELFYMYKFRSMRQDAESLLGELLQGNEASGHFFKMRRDPRITRVGRVIRRLSLDELPQLFNVLNGTMSLVGPRPPLPSEARKYEERHLRRLEAVPGLTGLWQVNRGSNPQFEEMVRMDLQYIQEWSLGLDLGILIKTVPAMLLGRGAY